MPILSLIFIKTFLDTWIWITKKTWTHEYEYRYFHEPWISYLSISMNPWILFLKNTWTHEYENWRCHKHVNMNMKLSWTYEYEYGYVTIWTFKSSYSSWNFMNHAMNSMNCNAWLWLLFAALSQNCELPKLWNPYFLLSGIKKSPEKKNKWKKNTRADQKCGWVVLLSFHGQKRLHFSSNTTEYFGFLGSVFLINLGNFKDGI